MAIKTKSYFKGNTRANVTVFEVMHAMAWGDVNRATLELMVHNQGDWMPDEDLKTINVDSLLANIVCECSSESDFSSQFKKAHKACKDLPLDLD